MNTNLDIQVSNKNESTSATIQKTNSIRAHPSTMKTTSLMSSEADLISMLSVKPSSNIEIMSMKAMTIGALSLSMLLSYGTDPIVIEIDSRIPAFLGSNYPPRTSPH